MNVLSVETNIRITLLQTDKKIKINLIHLVIFINHTSQACANLFTMMYVLYTPTS